MSNLSDAYQMGIEEGREHVIDELKSAFKEAATACETMMKKSLEVESTNGLLAYAYFEKKYMFLKYEAPGIIDEFVNRIEEQNK